MNKTKAIKKINKMGKAGSIICLIAKIILFIAAFFVLATTIVFFVLPKDFVTISTASNVKVFVNMETITKNMSAEEIQKMNDSFNTADTQNSSLTLDNSNYAVNSYSFENNILTVNTDATGKDFTFGSLRGIMIVALLSISCSLLSIFFAGSLCKSFAVCESPFDEVIISRMRKLAFSLIPMAVLSCFSDSLVSGVVSSGNSVSFSVNFSAIFSILVILAMSFIFKYGAQLQEESDETL